MGFMVSNFVNRSSSATLDTVIRNQTSSTWIRSTSIPSSRLYIGQRIYRRIHARKHDSGGGLHCRPQRRIKDLQRLTRWLWKHLVYEKAYQYITQHIRVRECMSSMCALRNWQLMPGVVRVKLWRSSEMQTLLQRLPLYSAATIVMLKHSFALRFCFHRLSVNVYRHKCVKHC